ncbi:MAG: hypothetical protein MJE66_01230 [Proteobacteria bacterium]|nr:hypothetical protein [Pseudomonadota bacterium]
MSASALALVAGTLAALVASAAHAEFDPFEIPRAEFLDRVQVIGLAPVSLPASVERRDEVRALVERTISDFLLDAGFGVVDSKTYLSVWTPLSERMGGTHDPATGETTQTWKIAAEHTFRELADRHRVDAVLHARVAALERFTGHKGWRLFGEAPRWKGKSLRYITIDPPQRLVAAHVSLLIVDGGDAVLYSVSHPVEWWSVFKDRSYEEIADEQKLRVSGPLRESLTHMLSFLAPNVQ